MNDTSNKYFNNLAFREYIFLLVELERLFREGRGQTAEADALRNAMDFPSDKLDGDEVKTINFFADDLTRLSKRYRAILSRAETASASGNGVPGMTPGQTDTPEHSK
jgi:hypothetical protein